MFFLQFNEKALLKITIKSDIYTFTKKRKLHFHVFELVGRGDFAQINRRGGVNKLRGGGQKFMKKYTGGDVYLRPKSTAISYILHRAGLGLIKSYISKISN